MVPGPIFNEVFFSLKDDFLSNKVDSTVSRVEVLYLLTRLEVFNPQHQLFSAELGAKYLVFVSFRSVKMRELSFAQFV